MKLKKIDKTLEEIEEVQSEEVDTSELKLSPYEGDMSVMHSTGSTLLDLAISGNRCYEGGIPSGILMEIFGPSGCGKTAIASEILGYAQARGGETRIRDPEARFEKEYSRIYGVDLASADYNRADTVEGIFEDLLKFKPENKSKFNVEVVDSLAALITNMEIEDKDKRGQARAKEFSKGFRMSCRHIRNESILLVCTNQVRVGDMGTEVTPGGKGPEFYASLRLRIGPPRIGKLIPNKISIKDDETTELSGDFDSKIGIKSICSVKKSSVDVPYREADVYIVFGLGVDDIRGNLQFNKDVTSDNRYNCLNNKMIQGMDRAIAYIEENDLEKDLKERTLMLWHELNERLKIPRKQKKRG